jgi:hypothetical protein
MGEARCRGAAILELKRNPKPRDPRHDKLEPVRTDTTFHFDTAATRRAAGHAAVGLNNVKAVTDAVNAGQVSQSYVHAVPVKVQTLLLVPVKAKPAGKLPPWVLVTGKKLTRLEFADHVLALAHFVPMAGHGPKGFRQPSAKEKNWASTSLVEQASIAAGLADKRTGPERSKRGEAKFKARQDSNAAIVAARGRPVPMKYMNAVARRHAKVLSQRFVAEQRFKEAA